MHLHSTAILQDLFVDMVGNMEARFPKVRVNVLTLIFFLLYLWCSPSDETAGSIKGFDQGLCTSRHHLVP